MAEFKKIKKGQILFRLMKPEFFERFENIDEFEKKNHRAHGILIIKLSSLDTRSELIAIPMRSSLKPYQGKQRYIIKYKQYEKASHEQCVKGLDLSKLLFIDEGLIDFSAVFYTADPDEQIFYRKRFNQIFLRATNYIEKYIDLCNKIDELTPQERKDFVKLFRFSTLRNFHEILKISITKESVKQHIEDFIQK